MTPYIAPGLKRKLPHLMMQTAAEAKCQRIEEIVLKFYGVTLQQYQGRSRIRHICNARHICMYLMNQYTKSTLKAIGERSGRDHTSVLHAIKSVTNSLICYPDFKEEFNQICALLERK